MYFSEAIVANDIKVDICNQLNDFVINTKGQRHYRCCSECLRFLSSSPLKLLGGLKNKLQVEPLLDGGKNMFMGSGLHDQGGRHSNI